jgi:hypothetical protein
LRRPFLDQDIAQEQLCTIRLWGAEHTGRSPDDLFRPNLRFALQPHFGSHKLLGQVDVIQNLIISV